MVAHAGVKIPFIVDIKRGSDVDGPGLRSVVFFKGCPLRCVFCHNPETQDPDPELSFNGRLCIRCRRCIDACPTGAIGIDHSARLDRSRCHRCGLCADACPTGALRKIGCRFSVDELVALLLRDEPFYRHSGGGVTLSGGECTLCGDYLEAVGRRLKSVGVHVAIQTCGMFSWSTFRDQILPWVDLIFYDVKVIDSAACRRVTGASCDTVLANLLQLLKTDIEVRPTVPLIPELTASEENLNAIVAFLRKAGARSLTPRAWNPLGLDSYRLLGRPTPDLPERFLRLEEERKMLDLLQAAIAGRKR